LHRIILGEVTRFPLLGEVFWQAGPKRNLAQIEAFMRRSAVAGSLDIADTGLAAEQFVGLVRGEIQLQQLLRLEPAADPAALDTAVAAAVATFLRAFRAA
jgi:TetR/AcrR family transcriptional repressor of mexJK operon